MTMFKSTLPTDRKIVIKLGGSTLEGLKPSFFENLKTLQNQGYTIVITHGGGPAINKALAKRKIESQTINGLRVTTDDMIEIVQETLIGNVNPSIVKELNAVGFQAIGLNGFDANLLQAEYLDYSVYGHVGNVEAVNTTLLNHLLQLNCIPVIACIGVSPDGAPLNVNGDTVACHIAKAIQAESLLLVTDVAGIRVNGEYQSTVMPHSIHQWIEQGEIYGGMIPKVEGALSCLKAGIPSVQIVNETLLGTTILSEELVK